MMKENCSINEKIKHAKRLGNEARNATYQLRSDINELSNLNQVISSISFLGTRQLLNQQRTDYLENISEELERQSEEDNLIDIEDIKISIDTLNIEHRAFLNLQLQKINEKTIEVESLLNEVQELRREANKTSKAFNRMLERFAQQLSAGELSLDKYETEGQITLEQFEERINKANKANLSIKKLSKQSLNRVRRSAMQVEQKIISARKNKETLRSE